MEYLEDNLDIRNLGILLMFLTGIRVGELVTLKHEDFTEVPGCYSPNQISFQYFSGSGGNGFLKKD